MRTIISALGAALWIVGMVGSATCEPGSPENRDMSDGRGRHVLAAAWPPNVRLQLAESDRVAVLRTAPLGSQSVMATILANQKNGVAAFKIAAIDHDFDPRPQEIIIDVMVAFTAKAAANYADIRHELIDLAIEQANESFRLSGLGHIKLRVVHAYRTTYAEEGSLFIHLWRFADKGDGYMEEVHELRDKYRADVAVLILDNPEGCGLAARVRAEAEEAFAVVHHECAAANYSFAHEIGHLIGASHELGYVNGTKWRDIMGYRHSCGGCPRLPVWSNPDLMIDNQPAGTVQRNNARVIAEQAARVAAFR